VLDEAMVAVDQMKGSILYGELHRLQGELWLKISSDNSVKAGACFSSQWLSPRTNKPNL